MSTGEVKKVSPQDLQLVQNLIERCLQLYMSQKEVVSMLLCQAKIEPSFTELVWQKLEEENEEFFKAYHLRLTLKDQIMKFNELLQKQAELMCQMSSYPAAAASVISNGAHVSPMHQNSSSYPGQVMGQEKMHQPIPKLPGGFTNGGSPLMQSAANVSGLSGRKDVSTNGLLDQHPSVGIVHGPNNDGMIKSGPDYGGEPSYIYGATSNRPAIIQAPISSFIGQESSEKPLNEANVDPDMSSFGLLGQIPRNFSLSDLTADFSVSSDILDNYTRSPYLATDINNFSNPHGNGNIQGDGKRLDTVSEGWSCTGFGSD